MRYVFIVGVVLLLLASCAKPECESDAQCASKQAFTVSCSDEKCLYAPVPNVCGNSKCDVSFGETNQTCEVDCGACKGKVSGAKYLEYQLVQGQCVEGVIPAISKQVSLVSDAANAGDKFHVETEFSAPFNVKKDVFKVVMNLEQGAQVRDERIVGIELSGTTKDKRKVVVGRKQVNRRIWEGVPFEESLFFDFPLQSEDELTSLVLKVQYEYAVIQGEKLSRKEGVFQILYREKLVVISPKSDYPCPLPKECDDRNSGTRDFCSVKTNFFCAHEPLVNACGNGVCESNENKCSCVTDCGVCGGGGSFTENVCKASACVVSLRASAVVKPSNVFESRDLGPVTLNNNYRFGNPLVAQKDAIVVDFKVAESVGVSNVIIQTMRIFEGSNVLAEVVVNRELGEVVVSVPVSLPARAVAEGDVSLTVGVWYSFVRDEKTQTGSFQKALGKVSLVSLG